MVTKEAVMRIENLKRYIFIRYFKRGNLDGKHPKEKLFGRTQMEINTGKKEKELQRPTNRHNT